MPYPTHHTPECIKANDNSAREVCLCPKPRARAKYEACPACEACFKLVKGEPFPPHRGIRGGVCSGAAQ